MCKFETIGVEYQKNAYSKEDADRKFRISCDFCSRKGLSIECDRCAIAVAHSFTLSCFDLAKEVAPVCTR